LVVCLEKSLADTSVYLQLLNVYLRVVELTSYMDVEMAEATRPAVYKDMFSLTDPDTSPSHFAPTEDVDVLIRLQNERIKQYVAEQQKKSVFPTGPSTSTNTTLAAASPPIQSQYSFNQQSAYGN
jgi:hypothetical protein